MEPPMADCDHRRDDDGNDQRAVFRPEAGHKGRFAVSKSSDSLSVFGGDRGMFLFTILRPGSRYERYRKY